MPGEVIVTLEEGVSLQSVTALRAAGVEFRFVRRIAGTRMALYRAEGLDQNQTLAAAQQLNRQAMVAEAFPNWILRAQKTPNDPLYPLQWHYPLMNLPAAWDITDGSSPPVNVAVVDTGIIAHPDFQGRLLPGYDFISNPAEAGDGDGRDNDPTDEGGDSGYHGAHVAGTIGAATNNGSGVAGVSWGARIVPVRVLGVTGGGSFADILEGIYWAVGGTDLPPGVPPNPNPARVVNLSLGGEAACPNEVGRYFQDLANLGFILVVAAGNENKNAANFVPASCPGVLTVGAVGPQGRRAPYSNYGTRIDVMAPGGDTSQSFTVGGQTFPAGVLSPVLDERGNPFYAFYNGTSMAAPHVAGLVALMLAREPGLDFQTIRDRLRNTSRPLSASDCNRPSGDECGAGLVDAARALGGSGGGTPSPPQTRSLTTYVVGFYCTNQQDCFPYDERRSRLEVIQTSASRIPFTLASLAAGPYLVAAWQDTNGNQEVDNGEPFGFTADASGRPRIIPLRAGEALAGLVIRMRPAEAARLDQARPGIPVQPLEKLVRDRF
ncbi:S8 family serine peptidase [Meiothermus sp. QL-1]|uniref:S8 family serine peptidase n=1 Tax=Meiothermus sp. QL-1 TaxID=2058095 RepID=UPI0013149FF6|nr:S8 family serine peptidase [Meiothermus sp. QL-1]